MPLGTSLDESASELVTNLSLLAFDFRVKCDSRSHVNASLAIFSLVEVIDIVSEKFGLSVA